MMSLHTLTHTGRSSKNGAAVLEYLKATEYYRDANGSELSSSRWWGKGAKALGLEGVVDAKDMDHLARGFAPDGTTKLVQNAGKDSQRVGTDCTFSAPKSVSVLYAASNDEQREALRQAQTNAVNAALGFLQSRVETRRGKGGAEHMDVDGLVVSQHTHFGSRELDPQLHTHCLVYAVSLGEDGRWGSLDNHELTRNIRSAGALYRAELAHQLQQLGFGVEQQRERDSNDRETGQVYFEVVGVDPELCERLSKRRLAIEAYVSEHQCTFQEACLATRQEKNEPSYDDLTKMWETMLAEQRQQHPSIFRSVAELKGLDNQLEPEQATRAQVLSRLHANNAVFSTPELIERLALEGVGRQSAADILSEVTSFQRGSDLQRIGGREHGGGVNHSEARRHREERHAATWMVAMEQEVNDRAQVRQGDTRVRISEAALTAAVQRYEAQHGFSLTDEQKAAAKFIACETGGLACLSGRAGTGKTTVSAVWIDALRTEGRNVIGCSTSWAAAKKLEAEAGITSFATVKLLGDLDKGETTLTARDVVVLDEAGMVGTPTLIALQRHCDQAGAKLVCQGDHLQLQPIEAGSPFRIAIGAIGDKKLTEIRRQKDQDDRDTANLFYAGKSGRGQEDSLRLGKKIYQRLETNGHIVACTDQKRALLRLADDYVASVQPASEKLVIAGQRAEVSTLNRAIRERLVEQGEVGRNGHTFTANNGRSFEQMTVADGDRIRFGKRDTDMGISNGDVGVVTGVRITAKGSLLLTVRLESDIAAEHGRTVKLDTATYHSMTHAYAMTVHKSQGQGKQEVFHLANAAMADNQSALVAFTRSKAKGGYKLYGDKDGLEELRKKLGMERLKENARDNPIKGQERKAVRAKDRAPSAEDWTKKLDAQWGQLRATAQHLSQRARDGIDRLLGRTPERERSSSRGVGR